MNLPKLIFAVAALVTSIVCHADPRLFADVPQFIETYFNKDITEAESKTHDFIRDGDPVIVEYRHTERVGSDMIGYNQKIAETASGTAFSFGATGLTHGDLIRVSGSRFKSRPKGEVWAAVMKKNPAPPELKLSPEQARLPGCSADLQSNACFESTLKQPAAQNYFWESCLLLGAKGCGTLIKNLGLHLQKRSDHSKADLALIHKGLLAIADSGWEREPAFQSSLFWSDRAVLEQTLRTAKGIDYSQMTNMVQTYLQNNQHPNRQALLEVLLKNPDLMAWVTRDGKDPLPREFQSQIQASEDTLENLQRTLSQFHYKSREAYFSGARTWQLNDCYEATGSLPQRYAGFHLNLAMIAAIQTNGSLFANCVKENPNILRKNGRGDTLVHYLARYSSIAYLFTMFYDLDVNVKNKKGETPLDWAKTPARPIAEDNFAILQLVTACQKNYKAKKKPKPAEDPCTIKEFDSYEGNWMKKEMCRYCGSQAYWLSNP